MFDDPNVVLHCEKIDKIYPGTKALDGVSFDLLKGKVNVLIGENGAGKSTLMKMIAGIEQPSAGKMYMDGEEVYFKDTNAARAKGIGIIHQELSLFPNLTVYQNIFMCHEQKNGLFLNDKKHIEGARKIMERLEHEIPPETMVGDLRVGQQQMVEIARNLIFPRERTVLETQGGKRLRLSFDGQTTCGPHIAEMVLACQAPVSILMANTKELDGVIYGYTIIELPTDVHQADKIVAWLKNSGISFSEVE
jgi:ABC-type methionine transport system ATPase subunit